MPLLIGLSLALPLAACGTNSDDAGAVAERESSLVGPGSDPAFNAALNDRILVDPDLTDGANMNTAKVAENPLSGAIPPDTGYDNDASIAALDGAKLMRAPKPTIVTAEDCANCGSQRAVTLGGLAADQGGVGGGICDIRVVTFTTSASMQNVVDYYYTRARKSGYNAEYQIRAGEHILGGTRDNDGGAYFITFNRHPGGGTSVDIVANNGR